MLIANSEPGTNRPAGISHLTMPSFVQRPGVCVTVAGHVVSDAGLELRCAGSDDDATLRDELSGDEKALSDYQNALRDDGKELDEGTKVGKAPRWPPGLPWLASAPGTPASRLTRPPSHSFHGPRSVTNTWGTLDSV